MLYYISVLDHKLIFLSFIANNNSRNVEDLSAKGPEVNTVHDGLRPSFFGLTGTAPRSQRDGAPMLSTPSCSRTAERPNTISGSQPGGRGRSASRQKQVKVLVVDDVRLAVIWSDFNLLTFSSIGSAQQTLCFCGSFEAWHSM